MIKNKKQQFLTLGILLCLVLLSFQVAAIGLQDETFLKQINQPESQNIANRYKGILRVYIVEIESRWRMANKAKYHYAMYDFAFNGELEIPFEQTHEESITWAGSVGWEVCVGREQARLTKTRTIKRMNRR